MTNIQLTWYQRIYLWNRIGLTNATCLREVNVYSRLIDKLRPTDDEINHCEFKTLNGGYSWRSDIANDFGDLDIALENDEADHMIKALETENPNAPIPVKDGPWLNKLVENLKCRN